MNAQGIVWSFKQSDASLDVAEVDISSAQAHFEHGQWWIVINATGQSFSVVTVRKTNGAEVLDFEML